MQLRRGLLAHVPDMRPAETHLFVVLLMLADYEGEDRGMVRGSLTDLAGRTGMDRRTLMRAMARLRDRGFVEQVKAAQNQHKTGTVYLIGKYDSASAKNVESGGVASDKNAQNKAVLVTKMQSASDKNAQSAQAKAIRINSLQAPKKERRKKEEKEEKEEGLDLAWEKLSAVYPHPGNLGQARISWETLIASSESPGSDAQKVLESASTAAESHALDANAQRSRALPSLANFLEGGWQEDRTGVLEALEPAASGGDGSFNERWSAAMTPGRNQ